jgi:hypothetical protein
MIGCVCGLCDKTHKITVPNQEHKTRICIDCSKGLIVKPKKIVKEVAAFDPLTDTFLEYSIRQSKYPERWVYLKMIFADKKDK